MRITKYFVLETGFAHRTTEDDIHGGYYIPKGSWVFPNAWLVTQLECCHLSHLTTHSANRFMLRDPRTYSNPSMFKPERFLPHHEMQPELDPRTICFGFGRRYCFPQHFHHSEPLCRSQDLPRSTYLTLHNHENADIT